MLTEQQNQILQSKSKKIVVLACPGSGKTTVIAKKIVMLNQAGVPMSRILSVTFTRKAAKEMLERIEDEIIVAKKDRRNISTLHSLGSRILYQYRDVVGLRDGYKIALEADKERILNQVLPNQANIQGVYSSFLAFVSKIKNDVDMCECSYGFTQEQFVEYCNFMVKENLVDLDDYIYLPVKILSQNDYIRNKVSKRYEYIFIDEYQDINATQNHMLDLITTDETFVMYVGDDDQSIYEFRGSKASFILEKTSPKSDYDVFYLTVNFRSRKPIVDFSKQILSTIKDPERAKKEIVSNEGGGGQKPVRHKPFSTKEAEIRYVVDEIHRLITESSVEPKEIAVLSRYSSKFSKTGTLVHSELHEIETGLKELGIPTRTAITLENDRESLKQIRRLCETLAAYAEPEFLPEYLNLLENNVFNSDRFAKLLNLINEKYHTEYSTESSFAQLMDSIIELDPDVEMASFQKRLEKYIRTYSFSIEQFHKVKNGAMPTEIISNIIAYLVENNAADEATRNIYEYAFSFAKTCEVAYDETNAEHTEYTSIVNSMGEFLCEQEQNQNRNGVHLLTAHQSKGLQFDVVFVVGMEVGNFPSTIDVLTDHVMDNERRLFYVCVTRARELLYLSSTGVVAEGENKELVDKSLIYCAPENYFSQEIKGFNEFRFTVSDKEGLRQLAEKEAIVSKLEDDYYLTLRRLQETLNQLAIAEEANKELLEQHIDPKELEELRQKILTLLAEKKNNLCRIEDLEACIERYKASEQAYKAQVSSYVVQSEDDARNLALLQKSLLDEKRSSEALTSEKNYLYRQLENEQVRAKNLSAKILNLESKNTLLEHTVAEAKAALEDVKKKERRIACFYDSILNIPIGLVDAETREGIKFLYQVFVVSKRYTKVAPFICAGFYAYQQIIESTVEYLNNRTKLDIYRARIRANNFKGSFDVIVRVILEIYCGHSNLMSNSEFKIGTFLSAYTNRTNENPKYQAYVNCYKSQCPTELKISRQMAEDMWVLNALTSSSNHDTGHSNRVAGRIYQQTIDEFYDNPSVDYYRIFSSYIKFIALNARSEPLLVSLNSIL